MSKYFTLLDFSCIPMLDGRAVGLFIIAVIIIIVSMLIALYIYPNRRESVITTVSVTAAIVTVITTGAFFYTTSFKCDVILTDGTRQIETQVATYRYPELGMQVVLISREDRMLLMNKLHSTNGR
jgi:hypothetical protein